MTMEIECAPLEGITDAVFRRTHQKYYSGVTRYYTPFISPTQHHVFTARQLRELNPANNGPLPPVPQLLGKNAGDILWAANELAEMGYREINLNLGCPSATVTAKGKGAGLLEKPAELDAFLDDIFRCTPVEVSIKTRIGFGSPEEFPGILAIYSRYPVRRLIIHPRTRTEFYHGPVHRDMFRYAAEHSRLPLCYNGDLFTPADVEALRLEFPGLSAIMLGRGLAADPALPGKLHGVPGDKETLQRFMDELGQEYIDVFEGPQNALRRMKALWAYVLCSFRDGNSFRRRLGKLRRFDELSALAEEIFQKLDLLPAAELENII